MLFRDLSYIDAEDPHISYQQLIALFALMMSFSDRVCILSEGFISQRRGGLIPENAR